MLIITLLIYGDLFVTNVFMKKHRQETCQGLQTDLL